jgi:hypothetical protein
MSNSNGTNAKLTLQQIYEPHLGWPRTTLFAWIKHIHPEISSRRDDLASKLSKRNTSGAFK